MSATKKLLVELSNLPCSVVIIGIGKADFDDMQELDGDKSKLVDDDGNLCPRDIVQFVEFEKAAAKGDLAEQVLKEIPNQFM